MLAAKILARTRRLRIVALFTLTSAVAYGQTAYGTITGTVKDSSGAVIAGAQVTVSSTGTNLVNTASTSNEGNYTVVNLLPGVYRVSAQFPGFKRAVTPPLILLVNQTLRADVALEPGTVETQVEVSASGVLIETDSSTIGKVVENKQIADLPLSSRNFMQLTVLSPGTVTDSGGRVSNEQRSFRSTLSGGAVWVGGARAASNAYMIDGVERRSGIPDSCYHPSD